MKLPTRNGKIARLPRAVREVLNRRLQDGEQAKKLVVWLNTLPEVRAVMAAEFGGGQIREQSLSEWRKGGYREWLAQQDALEAAERLCEHAVDFQAQGNPPLTDTLALWLAARYAAETRRIAESDGPEGWRLLREMCGDVVELRRGDHSAQRLLLERERVDSAALDAGLKWKRRIIIGLETLTKYVDKHPEAKAALQEIALLVRHPFDPGESE